MYCRKCGAQNDNGDVFCGGCGAPLRAAENKQQQAPPVQEPVSVPHSKPVQAGGMVSAPTPRKRKSMGLLIGIIVGVLVVAGFGAYMFLFTGLGRAKEISLPMTIQEKSFSTPEDAIKHFVAAVSKNDFGDALSACAVNETALNFDAEAYMVQLKTTRLNDPGPKQYDFYRQTNQVYLLSRLSSQMKIFAVSFSGADAAKAYITMQSVAMASQDYQGEARKFAEDINPAYLKDLSIGKIVKPENLDNDNEVKNLQRTATTYGADESTEREVLYQFNGQYFAGGFDLLRYGKDWKIMSIGSVLIGNSPYGNPDPITESQYQDAIK